MRMAVDNRWRTVSGPSGVCNTSMCLERLGHVDAGLVDELLELGNLAHLLEGVDLISLVSIDGQTSRVIPTVF
jgi:hypothetical protein